MGPMHLPEVFEQLAIVFAAAVAVALVLHRLKVPAVAGLLVAGAVIGPDGLGFVSDPERIEVLAEVGVVLLLFTIGLEFSLTELRRLSSLMLKLGLPQVTLTALAVVGLGVALGFPWRMSLFFGFLVALSSTAIVLQALGERGDTDAPHGRATLGVLLLQDLFVVPMILVLPALAGRAGDGAGILVSLGKAAALLGATLVLGRLVIPRALDLVTGSRRRDLFVMTVLLICAGVAWVTALAGLSLALGAFLAGVLLADSEYGHQALADVLPLRDAFASIFFVSMGLLLEFDVLAERGPLIAAIVLAIVAGKAVLTAGIALLAGLPLRVAVLAGVALAQVGEFSFVLARQGGELGLLDEDAARIFIAASVLTMLLTPLLMNAGPSLAAWAARHTGAVAAPDDVAAPVVSDHVVVLGFGHGGQMLAEALRTTRIPYAIIDIDAERVRRAKARGEPAHFGDVAAPGILERAAVARARHVVLVINDPDAARRAVSAIRQAAPGVPITVRSRYLAEVPDLEKAGATDVVVQEFEATVEIIARVLRLSAVPRNVIEDQVRQVRERAAPSERLFTIPRRRLGEMTELTEMKIESFLVREGAWISGRTLAGSGLRTLTGASIIAVGRGAETAVHPDAGYVIGPADVLYLVGEAPHLEAARQMLERGPAA